MRFSTYGKIVLIMSKNKNKIVIVGGGFGGLKAALELSREPKIEVTLITNSDVFKYFPSLYHTAVGGSKDVSSIPIKEIFSDSPSVKIVIDEAKIIDRQNKTIKTLKGEIIEYQALIIALGVVTNYFGIPGLDKFAFGIKSPEEAERLKNHLHKQSSSNKHQELNYVIVGGGPTGIELAGVLGEYVKKICENHSVEKAKIHVDLVEAAPRLVPRLPKDISIMIARQLKKRGVKLYLNSAVKSLDEDELMVNNKPIRSHTVIWTAGVANHPFFTENNFQLSMNHKVRVDQFLQAEPSIYVIGDNADTAYSGMAQTALYDGEYIANNMLRLMNKEAPLPYSAKKPIYVMPAGPNWAAVLWGRIRIYGRVGWILRRAADLLAYKDYEPWFKATKHWLAEYKKDDHCIICQSKES